MRTYKDLCNELSNLQAELNDIYTMSEEAVCFRYNVDVKEDIIIGFQEARDDILRQIGEVEEEEARHKAIHYWGDPAFSSEAEFWKYKGI